MNLLQVMETFSTQEHCIAYLERLRWGKKPFCPHCGSLSVGKRNETDIGRIGRYNCHDCNACFKVTHGTLFHGTKIPLPKWFLAIALIANAKKSLSSYQLSRDLDLNQKTAWYMQTRIRAEMAKKGGALLHGIVEADETYIGGKPRKPNKREDWKPSNRGPGGGTKKQGVVGVVERGGKVVAQHMPRITGRAILEFVRSVVKMDETTLMTDESRLYNRVGEELKREIVTHRERFVDGEKYTNTLEGFWSLLKRAWYGSHHHYNTGYTPLYVAEACYKYNYRKEKVFWRFIRESVQV